MGTITDFRHAMPGAQQLSAPPPAANAAPTTLERAGARPGTLDEVELSAPVNPYADIAKKSASVRVDAWKKGPNDSVERILASQGYTPEEIYRKDSQGRSLIQRVAGVNDLADPNLVRQGQNLVVPVKDQPQAQGAPPTQAQAAAEGTSRVTIDPWGKGPNDSLERILVNQGYSLREIHARDRDGKSMLDRVAGENGLESPDSIRAGRELVVPSKQRQERGEQEQRREQPAREPDPKPASEAPKAPAVEPASEAPKAPAVEPTSEAPKAPAVEPASEAPKAPAVEPASEAPKAPAVEPASEPPRPPADGEATLEMGLMLDGVRQNRLTRDEFKALNGAANRYEEMRAAYGKDGFSPDELRDLGRYEEQYGKMYARFFEHDRSRIRIEANQTDDPRVQQRLRLTEEGAVLYDRYKAGEITLDDAAGLLMIQRSQARELGRTEGGL